jgi:putative flippase GtrA
MALVPAELYDRFRQLLPELLKFGVVGGIGTVVDLSGAALLHGKYDVGPLEAKAVSVTAATVITYLGSRFWTFKDRENHELKREAVLFIVLNVVGLAIAEAVVGIVTYAMSLHGQLEYNIASFLGTGCGTIFRYFAYKKWVFLPPSADPAGTPAAPSARRFPDYPPWELDPSVPAATAPAYGRVPAAHDRVPAAAPASHHAPERAPAWDPALAPTMSWTAPAPQPSPAPRPQAVRAPDLPPRGGFPARDLPSHDFPGRDIPRHDFPARDYPARDIPGRGFPAAAYPAPDQPPHRRPVPAPVRSPLPPRPSGGGRHRKS